MNRRLAWALVAMTLVVLAYMGLARTGRESLDTAAAYYDVEFLQRVKFDALGVDIETEFDGVVERVETHRGSRYRIVSVRKLGVAANGERKAVPDMAGAAVRVGDRGRQHYLNVEGAQVELAEVVRQLAFQAEMGECDEATVQTPLGRSDVRFDTCSTKKVSRRTIAVQSLRGIGELEPNGIVRGQAEVRRDGAAQELDGHERFVGRTGQGVDVDVEVTWHWSTVESPSAVPKALPGENLTVLTEKAYMSPKAKERALANARERATRGITLEQIESYLGGVTGAPSSSAEHALFGQAASYFRLHPEDLHELVARLATVERRPSRLRTLDLFAAVGTTEAQLAFWAAVDAHVSEAELPEAMLRAGLFREPADETVDRLEQIALSPASHAWQRGTLALGAAAGFRRDERGEAAVAVLEQQLRSRESRMEKSAVVVALGNAGRASSLELFAKVAKDSSPQLRTRTAEALRKLDMPRAQLILTELLRDEVEDVSAAAMKTLRRYEALIPSALDEVLDQAEEGQVANFALTHAVDLIERHGGSRRSTALAALLRHPHLGADLRARIRRQIEEQ